MTSQDEATAQIGRQYLEFREELLRLIRKHYQSALSKRCSPEDILQETAAAMLRNPTFLSEYPEMPAIEKWTRMTFNTISDINRRHLEAQKRTAKCEISFVRAFDSPEEATQLQEFLDRSVTTPRSGAELQESSDTLMKCIGELSEEDRRMITMRQLERCTAEQCAKQLGMTLKEVNAAHLRAVRHLRKRLSRYSGLLP